MVRRLFVLAVLLAACSSAYSGADAPPTGGDAGTPPPPTPPGASDASACGHTFCDDFDRTTPATTGWTTFQMDKGTATLSGGKLDVALPTPTTADVFLEQALPAPAKTVSFALDLDVATVSGSDEIDLVQLEWDPPPTPCSLFGFFLVRNSTGPVVLQKTFGDCDGGVSDETLIPSMPGMHHYEVTVTLGDVGHLVVLVDGNAVVGKEVRSVPSAPLKLRVGAGSHQFASPVLVHYDNVTADVN